MEMDIQDIWEMALEELKDCLVPLNMEDLSKENIVGFRAVFISSEVLSSDVGDYKKFASGLNLELDSFKVVRGLVGRLGSTPVYTDAHAHPVKKKLKGVMIAR